MNYRRQVGGSHYENLPIQPIELIEKFKLTYHEGNVLKYLMRYKYKNGREDLMKALDYLEMLKEDRNALTTCIFPLSYFNRTKTINMLNKEELPDDLYTIMLQLIFGRTERIMYYHLEDYIRRLLIDIDKHGLDVSKDFNGQ